MVGEIVSTKLSIESNEIFLLKNSKFCNFLNDKEKKNNKNIC